MNPKLAVVIYVIALFFLFYLGINLILLIAVLVDNPNVLFITPFVFMGISIGAMVLSKRYIQRTAKDKKEELSIKKLFVLGTFIAILLGFFIFWF
ncbi:hypothetical protein [Evansella tamaricis]|uniref:Uncharacterized protein n=1 Tax=Evansella tamaricis TaxID=2069301 RepID=A0ABS6JKZ0_9BACI|nr:hypothetical protein [Evansella tamaricis]MBU9714342.1 hypothetical protein [Evansella tamaricis]